MTTGLISEPFDLPFEVEAIASHEMGHTLGFISGVEKVDIIQDPPVEALHATPLQGDEIFPNILIQPD